MATRPSRATYAREWRVGTRQKRRLNSIASCYVSTKYPDIWKEICQFYTDLNGKYPRKHDLTKTKEFRKWKSEAGRNEMSIETTPLETQIPECESAMPEHETNGGPERESAMPEHETNGGPERETAMSEHETNGGPERESAMSEHETNDGSEREIPEEPMHDLIGMAARDLIPFSPQDDLINELINDLEQNNELYNILNGNEHGQPDDMDNDDDEGIELNLEIELNAINEPLDLEAEGFF